MDWLNINLRYFTPEQRVKLVTTVTEEKFNALTEDTKTNIKYLFSRIDKTTETSVLNNIYDCVTYAMFYGEPVRVYRVNQGENFTLVIEPKPEDDYTGFDIVARDNNTNTILAQIPGSDEPEQPLAFINLDLEAGGFYKVRIQLEDSGDGISLLDSIYLIVNLNIDA